MGSTANTPYTNPLASVRLCRDGWDELRRRESGTLGHSIKDSKESHEIWR